MNELNLTWNFVLMLSYCCEQYYIVLQVICIAMPVGVQGHF